MPSTSPRFLSLRDQLYGSNYRDDKNVSPMGIVYTLEESEIFSRNICGNEPQKCVQHTPLHEPAIRSTSSFSLYDLVT